MARRPLHATNPAVAAHICLAARIVLAVTEGDYRVHDHSRVHLPSDYTRAQGHATTHHFRIRDMVQGPFLRCLAIFGEQINLVQSAGAQADQTSLPAGWGWVLVVKLQENLPVRADACRRVKLSSCWRVSFP